MSYAHVGVVTSLLGLYLVVFRFASLLWCVNVLPFTYNGVAVWNEGLVTSGGRPSNGETPPGWGNDGRNGDRGQRRSARTSEEEKGLLLVLWRVWVGIHLLRVSSATTGTTPETPAGL